MVQFWLGMCNIKNWNPQVIVEDNDLLGCVASLTQPLGILLSATCSELLLSVLRYLLPGVWMTEIFCHVKMHSVLLCLNNHTRVGCLLPCLLFQVCVYLHRHAYMNWKSLLACQGSVFKGGMLARVRFVLKSFSVLCTSGLRNGHISMWKMACKVWRWWWDCQRTGTIWYLYWKAHEGRDTQTDRGRGWRPIRR